MIDVRVTTQEALDAALADPGIVPGEHKIMICSPAGVEMYMCDTRGLYVYASGSVTVYASGSATVRAYGSATVRAYDRATVYAYDSATVEAYGSATVEASGSATVRAYGSVTVRAYDSATVRAYGSATVRAYDRATVEAYGSATVRAYGSVTVRAYDSATVEASGSATVRAYGSATVEAYGSVTVYAYGSVTVRASGRATVEAGTHVAVHRIDTGTSVTGGVLIDHTGSEQLTARQWCGYTGTSTVGDEAVLYKALASSLVSGKEYGRTTEWPTEGVVSCDDWDPSPTCGGGLHLSPTPWQAQRYMRTEEVGTLRYLECRVSLDDLVPIPGGPAKVKARRVRVVREVTVDGTPVGGETA